MFYNYENIQKDKNDNSLNKIKNYKDSTKKETYCDLFQTINSIGDSFMLKPKTINPKNNLPKKINCLDSIISKPEKLENRNFDDFENRKTIRGKSNPPTQALSSEKKNFQNQFNPINLSKNSSDTSKLKPTQPKTNFQNLKSKFSLKDTLLKERVKKDYFEQKLNQSVHSHYMKPKKSQENRKSHNPMTMRNMFKTLENPYSVKLEAKKKETKINSHFKDISPLGSRQNFVSNFLNLESNVAKKSKKPSTSEMKEINQTYFSNAVLKEQKNIMKLRNFSLDIDHFNSKAERVNKALKPKKIKNADYSYFSSSLQSNRIWSKRETQEYEDAQDLQKKVSFLEKFESLSVKKKRGTSLEEKKIKKKFKFDQPLFKKEEIIEAYDQLIKEKEKKNEKSILSNKKQKNKNKSQTKTKKRSVSKTPKRSISKKPEKKAKKEQLKNKILSKKKKEQNCLNIKVKTIPSFDEKGQKKSKNFQKIRPKINTGLKPVPSVSFKEFIELEKCRLKKDFNMENIILPHLTMKTPKIEIIDEVKQMNQIFNFVELSGIKLDNIIKKIETDKKEKPSSIDFESQINTDLLEQLDFLGFNFGLNSMKKGIKKRKIRNIYTPNDSKLNNSQIETLCIPPRKDVVKVKKTRRKKTKNKSLIDTNFFSINLDDTPKNFKPQKDLKIESNLLKNCPQKKGKKKLLKKRKKLTGVKSSIYTHGNDIYQNFFRNPDVREYQNMNKTASTIKTFKDPFMRNNTIHHSEKAIFKKWKKVNKEKFFEKKKTNKTVYYIPKKDLRLSNKKPFNSEKKASTISVKYAKNAVTNISNFNEKSEIQPSMEYYNEEPANPRINTSKKKEFMYRLNNIKARKKFKRHSLVNQKLFSNQTTENWRNTSASKTKPKDTLNITNYFREEEDSENSKKDFKRSSTEKVDQHTRFQPSNQRSKSIFSTKTFFPLSHNKKSGEKDNLKKKVVAKNRSKSQIILKDGVKKLKKASNISALLKPKSSRYSVQSIFKSKKFEPLISKQHTGADEKQLINYSIASKGKNFKTLKSMFKGLKKPKLPNHNLKVKAKLFKK